MSAISFWALSIGYLGAALAAALGGPRGLRPAAGGVALTLVLSTIIGTLPPNLRPSIPLVDVGSSFLLACWILIVALRYPTTWNGGLLVLQGLELALAAIAMGVEADSIRTPFARMLDVFNVAMIVYLSASVLVKQLYAKVSSFTPQHAMARD